MSKFLSNHIHVTPHSSDPLTFLSQDLWVPSGARGVFGGQILAQSIMAATSTVTAPAGLHSAHCYFLLPAQQRPTIQYKVEKLSDGRSYSSRLVRAWQGDKEIFVLMASYARPSKALPQMVDNQAGAGTSTDIKGKQPMTSSTDPLHTSSTVSKVKAKFEFPFPKDVRPASDCEDDAEFLAKWLERSAKAGRQIWEQKFFKEYIQERRTSPVSISRAHKITEGSDDPGMLLWRRMIWLRIRALSPEDGNLEIVKAMIAYMSDFQFIGTTARSIGLNQNSTPRLGMLASLDHTIHFYPFPEHFDPSAPLLHVMESQAVDLISGRGVARGRIYTSDGHLLAITAQEGVVRASMKGKKAKGMIEGGMADIKEDAKAKL
ncbi:acyl-CoA thioesterase II [Cryptococcus depauperatus CBS 7841]|uniref:Acyl-CoA thioesterase II n=1 Tax=Cryptococcus depauperatus CBS 7841 TaxID=1295531 RepID=A0A1E3IC04_9TREE|nr:acyl-CoA thioesterase II [Cryptococcus depauperatus CBS 7841]